jgi:hypothetical protein
LETVTLCRVYRPKILLIAGQTLSLPLEHGLQLTLSDERKSKSQVNQTDNPAKSFHSEIIQKIKNF